VVPDRQGRGRDRSGAPAPAAAARHRPRGDAGRWPAAPARRSSVAAAWIEPHRARLYRACPAHPKRLRFRYRLDGFDAGWHDAGTQRAAQYTNLAPGDYRFVVEAGIDGAWGKPGAIAITLRPRFYQTRW
jgi:hypothetical protein